MFEDTSYPKDYICATREMITTAMKNGTMECMRCRRKIADPKPVHILNISGMINPQRRKDKFHGLPVYFAWCEQCD
jgi:hypothetical protein